VPGEGILLPHFAGGQPNRNLVGFSPFGSSGAFQNSGETKLNERGGEGDDQGGRRTGRGARPGQEGVQDQDPCHLGNLPQDGAAEMGVRRDRLFESGIESQPTGMLN
jgi:hypothetical protein